MQSVDGYALDGSFSSFHSSPSALVRQEPGAMLHVSTAQRAKKEGGAPAGSVKDLVPELLVLFC